jgi:hypothetical protein
MMPGGLPGPILPLRPGTTSPTLEEDAPLPETTPAPPQEGNNPAEGGSNNSPLVEGGHFASQNVGVVSTRLVSYQADAPNTGGLTSSALGDSQESEPEDLNILYRPFDDVKEEIRQTLAREKAWAALPIIQKRMREYYDDYHKQFDDKKPVPPMPDLTDFVAEQGLEWNTVPLGDVFKVKQSELARQLFDRNAPDPVFRNPPPLFRGEIFEGIEGMILYWITEQKSEIRPEKLDEVREVVVKRWKEIEAQPLAMKQAEKLANEAKAADKSLADAFAERSDVSVVETEPFTWKTPRKLSRREYDWFFSQRMSGIPEEEIIEMFGPLFVLSEVLEKEVAAGNSEIDNKWIALPGNDFMESVFSLQIGEIGVVFNEPQSVVYIVRVTSSSPSEEALWEWCHMSHPNDYFEAGQPDMARSAYTAWLSEIYTKSGFRWVNKPEPLESDM